VAIGSRSREPYNLRDLAQAIKGVETDYEKSREKQARRQEKRDWRQEYST
jgi:hypothetical protein